jgi:hypothetical protein
VKKGKKRKDFGTADKPAETCDGAASLSDLFQSVAGGLTDGLVRVFSGEALEVGDGLLGVRADLAE